MSTMFVLTVNQTPVATAPMPQPLYDAAVANGFAVRVANCLFVPSPGVSIREQK